MVWLKKVNPEWQPLETPKGKANGERAEVGDLVQITDFRRLVQTGAALLVNEDGVEQPVPGQVFTCPICYRTTYTLKEFTDHVDVHRNATLAASKIKEEVVTEEPAKIAEEPVIVEVSSNEVKDKRLAALAKAREVRAQKLAQG